MPDTTLGLDIGSSHIKVVSLENRKDKYPRLLRYAMAPAKEIGSGLLDDKENNIAKTADALKTFLNENNFIDNKIVGVLPENKVFSKVISMPFLKGNEFKEAIEWEAEQHIPNPISEIYLKYTVLNAPEDPNETNLKGIVTSITDAAKNVGKKDGDTSIISESDGETMDVLLVAAPRVFVDKYLKILSKANLKALGLEPISLAVVRSSISNDIPIPSIVINFGQNNVDFYFSMNNTLRFVHTLNFGLSSIIKAIARELNISNIQANEYLYTYGLNQDVLNGKIREMILPVLKIFVDEINKLKRYLESREIYGENLRINRVILAGGGALIPNIMVYLVESIQPEVQYGNPWKMIDIDGIKNQRQLLELGPLFSAAAGAAIKGSI